LGGWGVAAHAVFLPFPHHHTVMESIHNIPPLEGQPPAVDRVYNRPSRTFSALFKDTAAQFAAKPGMVQVQSISASSGRIVSDKALSCKNLSQMHFSLLPSTIKGGYDPLGEMQSDHHVEVEDVFDKCGPNIASDDIMSRAYPRQERSFAVEMKVEKFVLPLMIRATCAAMALIRASTWNEREGRWFLHNMKASYQTECQFGVEPDDERFTWETEDAYRGRAPRSDMVCRYTLDHTDAWRWEPFLKSVELKRLARVKFGAQWLKDAAALDCLGKAYQRLLQQYPRARELGYFGSEEEDGSEEEETNVTFNPEDAPEFEGKMGTNFDCALALLLQVGCCLVLRLCRTTEVFPHKASGQMVCNGTRHGVVATEEGFWCLRIQDADGGLHVPRTDGVRLTILSAANPTEYEQFCTKSRHLQVSDMYEWKDFVKAMMVMSAAIALAVKDYRSPTRLQHPAAPPVQPVQPVIALPCDLLSLSGTVTSFVGIVMSNFQIGAFLQRAGTLLSAGFHRTARPKVVSTVVRWIAGQSSIDPRSVRVFWFPSSGVLSSTDFTWLRGGSPSLCQCAVPRVGLLLLTRSCSIPGHREGPTGPTLHYCTGPRLRAPVCVEGLHHGGVKRQRGWCLRGGVRRR
jgi:hypothetical protein